MSIYVVLLKVKYMFALERFNQKREVSLKYHLGCSKKKITGLPRPRSINKFKISHILLFHNTVLLFYSYTLKNNYCKKILI